MQQTRLNTLFDLLGDRIEQFFNNPWRRVSLVLISLLFGVFMGTAVATTAGQAAEWDVLVAALLIIFTEVISILAYRRNRRDASSPQRRRLWLDVLNAFKIGLTYSLYLEAFKLGS